MKKVKVPATYLYTGWKDETEKEYIHDEERVIEVGMGATRSVGSDAYPYHVSRISDSGKTVWIKRADFKAALNHDHFGTQRYIVTPNPESEEERVNKNKYGQWKTSSGSYVYFGHASAHQDPHF